VPLLSFSQQNSSRPTRPAPLVPLPRLWHGLLTEDEMITLSQAIAARGIDEQAAMRNARRRKPFLANRTEYIWPGSACPAPRRNCYGHIIDETNSKVHRLLNDVAYGITPEEIMAYVSCWSELNHLTRTE